MDESVPTFQIVDYTIFVASLILYSLIGFYYGVRIKFNEEEYLMGNRKMGVVSISFSLIVTYISGITILGICTDVYLFGMGILFLVGSFIIDFFVSSYVFLPVLYPLRLTSVYEYLELRFDRKIRLLGSILCTISTIIHGPLYVYMSALVFNLVTGINIHVVSFFIIIVCVSYTCLGGMKAVVLTDTIQSCVMYTSLLIIVFKGTADVGGLNKVWERNLNSGRLELPSWSLNPTIKYTIWTTFVFHTFEMTESTVCEQMTAQRFFSLPSLKTVRRALFLYKLGTIAFLLLSGYSGFLAYAMFYNCDPISSGKIQAPDQILPLLAIQVLHSIPGLLGVFVTGIASAALSSLSSAVNALSAIVVKDFVSPNYPNLSINTTQRIMKIIVIAAGIISFSLIFIIEKLGPIYQLTVICRAVNRGTMIGIFTAGICFPRVNSRGCLAGGVASMLFVAFISIGSLVTSAQSNFLILKKPVSVDGCDYSFNVSQTLSETVAEDDVYVFPLFKISYLLMVMIGCIVTVLVAVMVSYCTRNNQIDVNPSLLAPFLRKRLPKMTGQPYEEEIKTMIPPPNPK